MVFFILDSVFAQPACCHLFSFLFIIKPEFFVFLKQIIEECRQEAMEHMKVAVWETEPSKGESIEMGDKDDKGEPAGTTSLA